MGYGRGGFKIFHKLQDIKFNILHDKTKMSKEYLEKWLKNNSTIIPFTNMKKYAVIEIQSTMKDMLSINRGII